MWLGLRKINMPRTKRKRKGTSRYKRKVYGTSRAYRGINRYYSNIQRAKRTRNWRTAGELGVEYKWVDCAAEATVITNNWTGGEQDPAATLCLCAPTMGTGASQRDGRKIVMKSISMRGKISRNVGSDQADVRSPSVVRVAVYLDTQTNGQQSQGEEVYDDTHAAGIDVYGHKVLANGNRFRILWTQMFPLWDVGSFNDNAGATGSISSNCHYFEFYKRLDVPVTFTANAGTVADIADNSLHIIACSSGSTDYIAYQSRVRFVG